MYTLPDKSNDTPYGQYNIALVAAPPSPLLPQLPVPATVLMTPVDTVTYNDIYRNEQRYAYQNKLRSTELARKFLFDIRALNAADMYIESEASSYFSQAIQLGDSYRSAFRELGERTEAKLPPDFKFIVIDCDSKSAEIFKVQEFVDSVNFSSGKTVIRVPMKNAAKFMEFLQDILNYRSLKKLKPWNVKVDPLDI